jgi:hypothetical protein
MKKSLLILTFAFAALFANAQCTINPSYQDSVYNIWPDTIQNLPHAMPGVFYYTQIDLKTPTTLIEAASGDSSLTTIDTLLTSFYVGDWPVDSMVMVETIGAPSGINLDCNTPNCVYPGDVVGCANVHGTTNDPEGIYPITIVVNVYTHGTISAFGLQYPIETDLYSATGAYETIEGYNIVVVSATGLETFHQDDFALFQNTPNPFAEITNIKFNSPNPENIIFKIYNLLGEEIESQLISSSRGVNTINLNTSSYSEGIYLYSINNGNEVLTKRMIVKN